MTSIERLEKGLWDARRLPLFDYGEIEFNLPEIPVMSSECGKTEMFNTLVAYRKAYDMALEKLDAFEKAVADYYLATALGE